MSKTLSKKIHTVTAGTTDAGERLDRFLVTRLPEMSRSRLQALIAQGCVTCKHKTMTDAAAKVKAHEEFTLMIPETAESHILPQKMKLDIIFEDKHMLVLNKPAGLTVHPAPGHPDMTLVNALLAHCGKTLSGIGGVARPGIVHRIDKDTSGLLAVAKHDAAHVALSTQLAERTMKRTYLAVVWGKPKTNKGTITGNIGRSLANRQKMAVVRVGGKPAVTHYKVLETFSPGKAKTPLCSLIECNLETGRTHQIRVHMTWLGHPLVGDPVYGQSTESRLKAAPLKSLPEKTKKALLAFTRQALHAKALTLVHPATNKKTIFECDLPKDMEKLLKALEA